MVEGRLVHRQNGGAEVYRSSLRGICLLTFPSVSFEFLGMQRSTLSVPGGQTRHSKAQGHVDSSPTESGKRFELENSRDTGMDST